MTEQTAGANEGLALRKALLSTILCVLFAGFSLSCREKNVIVEPSSSGQNQPAIVSTLNTLTFSVDAVAFSFQSSSDLTFTGDSLVYVLSITGYAQGGGFFKVLNASGSVILSDSLNSNRSIVNTNLAGRIPSRFSITLTDFTGKLSIVLTAAGSSGLLTAEDFPNTIGSSWTYTIFDSIRSRTDTATVAVVGQTVLPGYGPATVRQITYRNLTDSQYVVFSSDTMTIYHQAATTSFVFPIRLGSSWNRNYFASSTVTQKGPIGVPAGNFPSGYQIREIGILYNADLDVTTWIVPKVGIVQLERKLLWILTKDTWRLIGYTIVP